MEERIKKEGNFEYVEEGEGPVLLLLHGLFGALSNFEDVVNHFSSRYKVVIPLMPLYTLPVINTNVKSLMNFVRDFIEYKNYRDISLLGNSLGGHVGLVYVSKHPERIKHLILTGSSGLYENAMGGSFPKRGDRDYIRKKVEVTFFDPKHATDDLVEECFAIVNDKGRLVRILSLAKSAIRHNMGKELEHIKQPTCLIWGKNDTITPPEVAEEFNELIPNSDLFWIDECGHAPMMEQPKAFNEILEAWLTKQYGN